MQKKQAGIENKMQTFVQTCGPPPFHTCDPPPVPEKKYSAGIRKNLRRDILFPPSEHRFANGFLSTPGFFPRTTAVSHETESFRACRERESQGKRWHTAAERTIDPQRIARRIPRILRSLSRHRGPRVSALFPRLQRFELDSVAILEFDAFSDGNGRDPCDSIDPDALRCVSAAKNPKDSTQKVVSSMSKKCGRLIKKLRCIQAIDASAWLCLEPGSVISEMVEKTEGGSTELSEEFANGPTFNTEDLINSMQLFSDIVSVFSTPFPRFAHAMLRSIAQGAADLARCRVYRKFLACTLCLVP